MKMNEFTKEALLKAMKDELNFQAKEYQSYKDQDVLKEVAATFKTVASAYNSILIDLFGFYNGPRFTKSVTRYIEQQKEKVNQ